MSRKSKRFTPGFWTGRLMPVLLVGLLLALLATLILIVLSIAGLTPGF
jgi:hypothetical protein